MKVLQINSFFTVGGPPRVMNGIYDALKSEGYDCKIAAAREQMRVPEDSIRIGGKTDAYLNALCCRILDDDGFRSGAATEKLIKDIEAYDPNVIHLHNLHGYYINIEMLFAYLKVCGKKIYWTLHDCWAFTGHCPHFTSVGCDKWKTGCSNCPLKTGYPSSYILDRSKTNYERKKAAFCGVPDLTIITPSEWLKNLVKQSFLGEYPVKVEYNKIDSAVFCPTDSDFRQKYGLENKKIVLGVAQNWSDNKGLSDFVTLAEKAGEQYKVVLVGLTDKQKKTLPDTILALGRTNDAKELAGIYSAADVFVNPSKEETFGLTTAEAAACGTPTVVYKNTACEEISAGFGGRAVEQNADALYAAVCDILHFIPTEGIPE